MHISYLGKKYALNGSLLAEGSPEARSVAIALDVECPDKEAGGASAIHHIPLLLRGTKGMMPDAQQPGRLFLCKLQDCIVAMYLEEKLYLASHFPHNGVGENGMKLEDLNQLYGAPVWLEGEQIAKMISGSNKKSGPPSKQKALKAGQKLSRDLGKMQRFAAIFAALALVIFIAGKSAMGMKDSQIQAAQLESDTFTKRTETLVAGKAGAVVQSLNRLNVYDKLQVTINAAPFLDIAEYTFAEKTLTVKFKNPERGALEVHELEQLGSVTKDGQAISLTFSE